MHFVSKTLQNYNFFGIYANKNAIFFGGEGHFFIERQPNLVA